MADELYARYPQIPEGKLTRLRAELVREEALAQVGRQLGLEELLRVEPGTALTASILADAVEALIGATYVDGGFECALEIVRRLFGEVIAGSEAHAWSKDAKTQLQEILQARQRRLPEYRVLTVRGAAHQQSFEVECVIADLGLSTSGSGTSRQRAEQQAAQAMLERLGT